jgi:soluble lytic murein transglycosylase-like protein
MHLSPQRHGSGQVLRHATAGATVCFALIFATSLLAQQMTPVVEHGRVVFRNDESEVKAAPAQKPVAESKYVYWSNTEQRWKPVPAPTRTALKAAQSAVAEVNTFVAAQPSMTKARGTVRVSPNYQRLAGGRDVSSEAIDRAIEEAAARHNVDPTLVKALIKVESNFNPGAVSRKGAMGLMQLMPSTARSLNVTNPFDPQQNVDAGVRHLKGLLENFGGDVKLTLAAYNAGQGAVMRSGGIPPYLETRNYVRRITDLYGNPTNITFGFRKAPIRSFRNERGVLSFSNVE